MDEIYKTFYGMEKDQYYHGKKLSLDIEKGGLKLTNLNIFIQGLKISWVQRLQKEGNWHKVCSKKQYVGIKN